MSSRPENCLHVSLSMMFCTSGSTSAISVLGSTAARVSAKASGSISITSEPASSEPARASSMKPCQASSSFAPESSR